MPTSKDQLFLGVDHRSVYRPPSSLQLPGSMAPAQDRLPSGSPGSNSDSSSDSSSSSSSSSSHNGELSSPEAEALPSGVMESALGGVVAPSGIVSLLAYDFLITILARLAMSLNQTFFHEL